jgi:hypothetical protein
MLNEKQYREEAGALAINIFEDLCRPRDADVEALKRLVGWEDRDVYGSDDPAKRALKEFLRARTTALDVKRRASEELAPTKPGA